MFESRKRIIDFAKEKADMEPLPRRVSLYRDLADFCGCPKESAELKARAVELELADLRCREFTFGREQQPTKKGAPTK